MVEKHQRSLKYGGETPTNVFAGDFYTYTISLDGSFEQTINHNLDTRNMMVVARVQSGADIVSFLPDVYFIDSNNIKVKFDQDYTGVITFLAGGLPQNSLGISGAAPPIGGIIGIYPDVKTAYDPDPNYWVLCDGLTTLPTDKFNTNISSNVPDLTDGRFMAGVSSYSDDIGDGGTSFDNGTGNNTFTLTIGQLPAHDHTVDDRYSDEDGSYDDWENGTGSGRNNVTITRTTSSVGNGDSISRLANYFKAKYYMRIN